LEIIPGSSTKLNPDQQIGVNRIETLLLTTDLRHEVEIIHIDVGGNCLCR